MPKSSFGYDADNAYHAALKAKVLADRDAARAAERERRQSLGLSETEKDEKKPGKGSWWRRGSKVAPQETVTERRAEMMAEGGKEGTVQEQEVRESAGGEAGDFKDAKKTVGEKVANLLFNAGKRVRYDEV